MATKTRKKTAAALTMCRVSVQTLAELHHLAQAAHGGFHGPDVDYLEGCKACDAIDSAGETIAMMAAGGVMP